MREQMMIVSKEGSADSHMILYTSATMNASVKMMLSSS